MDLYVVLILAVSVERLAELGLSRRNLAWARARGGREYGFGHYPFMVALHTGLLAASLIEATHRSFHPALGWPMLAVVVLAQALRWWSITSLGPRDAARHMLECEQCARLSQRLMDRGHNATMRCV